MTAGTCSATVYRNDRIEQNPQDRRHGTVGGYTNNACRCERCRAANAAYVQKRRYERAAALAADPSRAAHGEESTYTNWRCRCQPCTEARAAYYQRGSA